MVRVVVLTYCRKPEFLFGNTLVFKTLRTGFPTAELEVWDNASDSECFEEIRKAAEACGAHVIARLEKEVRHADWVEARVREAAESNVPLVIIDPDVVFWENVEKWTFPEGTLMAGRYIPRVKVYNAIVEPRLHTSFLWFPDPKAIVNHLDSLDGTWADFSPFRGSYFQENGVARHVDTCGALFSVFPPDKMFRYGEAQLNAYDHLWMGTSPDYMEHSATPEARTLIMGMHEKAKKDTNALRGAWRAQEAVFQRSAVTLSVPVLPTPKARPSEREMYLRWAQGNADAARLLWLFGHATQIADDLVDGDMPYLDSQEGRSDVMTRILYLALVEIPRNPFYHAHEAHFAPLFTSCLAQWDASNSWEWSKNFETRVFSYVTREACGRLIEMVAYLVGGFLWMRDVNREVHEYYHGKGAVEPFAEWDAEHDRED